MRALLLALIENNKRGELARRSPQLDDFHGQKRDAVLIAIRLMHNKFFMNRKGPRVRI